MTSGTYTVNLTKNLRNNIVELKNILNMDENFDVLYRTLQTGGKDAALFFVDGFVKDEVMEKVIEFLYSLTKEDMAENVHDMMKEHLPYIEIGRENQIEKVVVQILSGVVCLVIDGFSSCITIDARTYPNRSIEEPEKDKVLRGSKDGFVETLVTNTALIRRRVRNPELIMEMLNVGESSKTDIVLCYMKSRVDKELLNKMRDKINGLKVDSLTMGQQSLAECLYQHKWYNPYPKIKYVERPDSAAASVLEGQLLILVDNSPFVMVLPTSVFDMIEETDDYYFPPITGTYLRLTRYFINFITLLLTPTFLLLIQNPSWIPESFQFILLKDTVNVPIIFQFLIIEFAIDGMKQASLNTPSILSTPLSVAAALVLGEFSVNSGWFNPEVMLYMAFVAVANYSQASYELGYALKFMRILTLILTACFNIYGYIGGILIAVVTLALNRTISGKSYLYPLIPFKGRELARRIFRLRLKENKNI